ncbi:MAG TPA: hypothetical protein VG710_08980 [Opitutus sp.]|nr:hypothetical protein [Opitutus sp.]
MTPLDHLTAAFECLWETKMHLLRAAESAAADAQPAARSVLAEVAASRDRIEKLLIEWQARPSPAPASTQG